MGWRHLLESIRHIRKIYGKYYGIEKNLFAESLSNVSKTISIIDFVQAVTVIIKPFQHVLIGKI